MRIYLPTLVLALLLLWLPRAWLHRGTSLWRRRKRRSKATGVDRTPDDGSSLSYRRELTKPRNYLDLLRAAVAAAALVGGYGVAAAITAIEGSRVALVAQVGLLITGVLIQTVRWSHGRLSLSAPVFFVAGLSLVLAGPFPALCAFALAWVLSGVVPNAAGFLTIQTIALAVLAVFMDGLSLLAIVSCALCFLPVLLSLLAKRPLRVFSRRPIATKGLV